MSVQNKTPLGIIACPGGADFAGKVSSYVVEYLQNRHERKVRYLSSYYGREEGEVRELINFDSDLATLRSKAAGSPQDFRLQNISIPCRFTRFVNGEVKAEIGCSIRGMDIYIIQDIYNHQPVLFHGSDEKHSLSVNDNIMTLLTTIDAVKGSSPRKITLIIPAYPYSRQHKKRGREGLTAARLGMIFEDMGVNSIITLDIHSSEIENSFRNLHLENLHASYQVIRKLVPRIKPKENNLIVVAPDTGALHRNKFYAESLHSPLGLLYKERDYTKLSLNASKSNIKTTHLLGDVKGKTVFLADDMLGTGGTLIKAMEMLKKKGAKEVVIAVSLPLFTGSADVDLQKAHDEGLFSFLIGTNAVNIAPSILEKPWYVCADVSRLIGKVISYHHFNRSVSHLLDNRKVIHKYLEQFDS